MNKEYSLSLIGQPVLYWRETADFGSKFSLKHLLLMLYTHACIDYTGNNL